MDIWVHDSVKEHVSFILKRTQQQRDYIKEVQSSDRSEARKTELIDSALSIKDRFHLELGRYMEKGLIGFL